MPEESAMNFQTTLQRLMSIGMPACCVLACLESNYATAGDFYLLWHAMVASLLDIVQTPSNYFPPHLQEAIKDILLHRHSQLFSKGGNLYTPEYLAAVYLNPGTNRSIRQ